MKKIKVLTFVESDDEINDVLESLDGAFVRHYGSFNAGDQFIEFVGVSNEKFSEKELKKEISETEFMGIDPDSKEWKEFIK